MRDAFRAVGCCPLSAHHDPCALVEVDGYAFTCDEVVDFFCAQPGEHIEFDGCDMCHGVHTDPACTAR
jgi:hypothetical protein